MRKRKGCFTLDSAGKNDAEVMGMPVKCVYCGKEIIDQKRPHGDKDYSKVYKSSEHIIQNALGGKIESEKICCDRCNLHIEELIDKKFNDIFVPFISDIKDFKKTNNANSKPKYSGYALYHKGPESKIVRADVIKQSKVKMSREIIEIEKEEGMDNLNERKEKAMKNARVLFQDFSLDNRSYRQGLSKIAYNYALYSCIPVKDICGICETRLGGKDNELIDIEFKAKVIPFVPGNKFDEFIELHSEFFLFHHLILFSYGDTLWCYINLFNTFQSYVLLNDNYVHVENARYKIYGEEFQYVQSNVSYGYKDYKDVITHKAKKYVDLVGKKDMAYQFYINNDMVNAYFRIDTPLKYYGNRRYKFILYPLWIVQADKKQIDISDYTVKKFIQLNRYLVKERPGLTDKEFNQLSESDQEKVLDLLEKSMVPNNQ